MLSGIPSIHPLVTIFVFVSLLFLFFSLYIAARKYFVIYSKAKTEKCLHRKMKMVATREFLLWHALQKFSFLNKISFFLCVLFSFKIAICWQTLTKVKRQGEWYVFPGDCVSIAISREFSILKFEVWSRKYEILVKRRMRSTSTVWVCVCMYRRFCCSKKS